MPWTSGKRWKATGGFRMGVSGVGRAKAALSSGCKSHPTNASPAGSNRGRHGGDEISEAFDDGHVGECAGRNVSER